ncbi:hypothetical protein FRUB_01617 [Fimbriiglobus ruber]|uniref:Uncharacterized protein n=1 Tax=Fimbriiglobus ruber TaxID=1908690 RepID=A0A225E5A6_9BACT|nr:hypothetical protein FRUB_01617 [Fimbriiglobus ruber]
MLVVSCQQIVTDNNWQLYFTRSGMRSFAAWLWARSAPPASATSPPAPLLRKERGASGRTSPTRADAVSRTATPHPRAVRSCSPLLSEERGRG